MLMSGIYVLRMPSRYFKKDVSGEDLTTKLKLEKDFKDCVSGEAGGIILPAVRDENGHLLFDIEFVG